MSAIDCMRLHGATCAQGSQKFPKWAHVLSKDGLASSLNGARRADLAYPIHNDHARTS